MIELLELALQLDPNSCRANTLMANIYQNHQQFDLAARCYQDIYYQDKEFFPDVIEKMHGCYKNMEALDDFYLFIKKVYDETAGTGALIAYLTFVEERYGEKKAIEFILLALKRRPTIRGFQHFVSMQMNQTQVDVNNDSLDLIKELIAEYLKVKHRYSCRSCGFNSQIHYWSCPSCHEWEQLKPIRGLEGE